MMGVTTVIAMLWLAVAGAGALGCKMAFNSDSVTKVILGVAWIVGAVIGAAVLFKTPAAIQLFAS